MPTFSTTHIARPVPPAHIQAAARPAHQLPFNIIADDRERAGGWSFAGHRGNARLNHAPLSVIVEYRRLLTADYMVEGLPVWIERKSGADLIGSITSGNERFRAEHERLAAMKAEADSNQLAFEPWVIIEADFAALCDELESPSSTRSFSSAGLRGITSSWPQRYGVHWMFCGSRWRAEEFALGLFIAAHERIEKAARDAAKAAKKATR